MMAIRTSGVTPSSLQAVLVAVAGLIADYQVISYHYTRPPHPKFLLLPWRRFWIFTHVVSGSLEVFCLTVAFFSSNPQSWAFFGATCGLAGHVSSAATMVSMVYGQKTFMLPMYVVSIALHGVTAGRLLLDPTEFTELSLG